MDCPITKSPISHYVMTCMGSVYEKSAIEKWFQDNHTDPLTNIVVSTKHLYEIQPPFTLENIQKQSDQQKMEVRNGWGKFTSLSRLIKHTEKIRQTKIIKMKKAVENYPDKQLWQNYSNAIFDLILSSDRSLQDDLVTIALENSGIEMISKINFALDTKINVPSPRMITSNPRLGCGLQFLDLRTWKKLDNGLSLLKEIKNFFPDLPINRFTKIVGNKIFPKGLPMIGTNLSGITFYDCSFFRTDFSYANLSNVWFINCRFSGEQLTFYETQFNENSVFIDCLIERFNKYETIYLSTFQLLARGAKIYQPIFVKSKRKMTVEDSLSIWFPEPLQLPQ